MIYTFYVLESLKNGRYYVGSTENIQERLAKHNRGEVKSTEPYRPWKLVYSEPFSTRGEAHSRELQVKSWKKRLAIEKLIGSIV